jgi:hypothetical protein
MWLCLLIAACGGGGSSGGASHALPSAAGAKDLEALIPGEVGGITLQRLSMRGNEFASSGGATEETQNFIEGLGVATDDVAVAAGFGSSTDAGGALVVFIFRADGAGSERLLSVFKDALNSDRDDPLSWEAVTIGGKQVERAVDTKQDGRVYVYAQGDVLFYVAATREDDAAGALEALP